MGAFLLLKLQFRSLQIVNWLWSVEQILVFIRISLNRYFKDVKPLDILVSYRWNI